MPIKRVNYYDHEFLHAQDFIAEQDYHRGMRYRHNRLLHTPGIADGLDVTFQSGSTKVTIGSGTAVDDLGQEIVIPDGETRTYELSSAKAATGQTAVVYLTIAYADKPDDPTTETDGAGNTRVSEDPVITHLANPPQNPTHRLLLAKVTMSDTAVQSVDKSVRLTAGAVAGDLSVSSLRLKAPNVDSSKWVVVAGAGVNQASLTGSLSIAKSAAQSTDGNLTVAGALTVAGSVGIGSALSVGGNVGIGTTAPGRLLHVEGTEIHSGGASAGFSFGDRGTTGLPTGNGDRWVLYAQGKTARLWSQGAGAGDRLAVTAAGDVGIGTIAPTAKLQVAGGNAIVNNAFVGDVGHGPTWAGFSHFTSVATTSYGFLQSADGLVTLMNKKPGGGFLGFRVGNVDKVVMNDAGHLSVDWANANTGGPSPGLAFGLNSGEGIASKRSGNAWSLDFYTAFARRMSIANNGDITLGTPNVDHVTVFGEGAARMHITGGELLFLLHKNGVIIGKEWGGNGNLTVEGNLSVQGSKSGYIVDQFENARGDAVELGDVVVVAPNDVSIYHGLDGKIPLPEIELTDRAYDTRVCGIVSEASGTIERKGRRASSGELRQYSADELRDGRRDFSKVKRGEVGLVVTMGAFAHCKVDADIAPIEVGDLLTTSPTKGHAQKVEEGVTASGAILGKALGSRKRGKGTIPVLVMIH